MTGQAFSNFASDLFWSAGTIADWAVQTGLAVTGLCLFILIIRRPFARLFGARAAYMLWALPILRLFLPSIAVPWLGGESAAPQVAVSGISPPVVQYEQIIAPAVSLDWTAIMLALWLFGAALWVTGQAIRQILYLRHIKSSSVDPSDAVGDKMRRIASRIGVKGSVRVRMMTGQGPCITGLFRPIIILPRDFETRLSVDQQNLTLLHELMHVRRHDLPAQTAVITLTALGWFNPVIHMAARAFRADQEAACDASLLPYIDGETPARRYAQTLLHMATHTAPGSPVPKSGHKRRFTAEPALGLTLTHPLKDRLMMLKSSPKHRRTGTALAALLLAGGALLSAPYVASADPEDGMAGAGKHKDVQKTKSVIRIMSDDNGKKVDKILTVEVNDGEVEAWETDKVTGQKRKINLEDLESYDVKVMQGQGYALKMGDDEEWIISDHMDRPMPPHAGMHPPMPPNMSVQARIKAAQAIISEMQLDDDNLSPQATRSLAAARKALAKARAELDE
ncbi:M56 family metallopeptidase [Robiginitomaculum antarcticum]|uniref:M56 family metallopeptidase n=1 Tax=Robiginitomaculum antarcticum TaxID=437507 RepID=UPI00036A9CEF|nr:M56 family metallopeptidase [Robiginitomaculum antarcticum]